MSQEVEKDVLKFQIERSLKRITKDGLVLLTDILERESNIKFPEARKKLLDGCNDEIRSLFQYVDRFVVLLDDKTLESGAVENEND